MVRSVEYVESPWDELQRAWMLALAEYEASLCPHCGNPMSACRGSDKDRNNPWASHIFWALPPDECHIGTAVLAGHKEFDQPSKALIPRVKMVRRGDPRPYS